MKKSLVVYDTSFGNTEKIAHAISDTLGSEITVESKRVGEVALENLPGVDLLIVGSPTQGFRPTKAVTDLLKRIRVRGIKGIKVAAFDTRFEAEKLNSAAMKILINTGGYAAQRIGASLKKAGGIQVIPPQGFYVEDTEGPLKPGELERAKAWAKSVLQSS